MTATQPALPTGATDRRAMYRAVLASEARLWLREPMGVVWVLAFPAVLLTIFGLVPVFRDPLPELDGGTLVATYVPILMTAAIAMAGVTVLPTALASYREQGYLRRLSTTPVGPGPLLAAQLVVNAAAVTAAAALCLLIGWLGYDVALPRRPLTFALGFALAVVAVLGLGLVLAATLRSSRTVSAVGTVTFFPLMFLAGLWTPMGGLPTALRLVSEGSPLGSAVAVMAAASQDAAPQTWHLVALALWAAGTPLLARLAFRWE